MKLKILAFALCVIAIVSGTIFGVLKIDTAQSAATAPSKIETSSDIGAVFDAGKVDIRYGSPFAPVISRTEAITIALNDFKNGFGIPTDNLQIEATVAVFNGELLPYGATPKIVNEIPAWIVVLKGVQHAWSFGGPDPDFKVSNVKSQYNLAIDATTGVILNGGMTGTFDRTPVE